MKNYKSIYISEHGRDISMGSSQEWGNTIRAIIVSFKSAGMFRSREIHMCRINIHNNIIYAWNSTFRIDFLKNEWVLLTCKRQFGRLHCNVHLQTKKMWTKQNSENL